MADYSRICLFMVTISVVIQNATAFSEASALIALSIFIAIPGLFILTCCCSIVYIIYYRNKIPIFKSFVSTTKTGVGIGKGKKAAPAPRPAGGVPPPHAQYAPAPMPPPGAPSPSAPAYGERPPGNYEMPAPQPVGVDDVVVPIHKE